MVRMELEHSPTLTLIPEFQNWVLPIAPPLLPQSDVRAPVWLPQAEKL